MEWLRLAKEQTTEGQALYSILTQMPAQVERMRDQQQKWLCNAALDTVSDDFRRGVKPHPVVLHDFWDTLNAIDSTVRVNGNRA